MSSVAREVVMRIKYTYKRLCLMPCGHKCLADSLRNRYFEYPMDPVFFRKYFGIKFLLHIYFSGGHFGY